jgi:hypothetical protein
MIQLNNRPCAKIGDSAFIRQEMQIETTLPLRVTEQNFPLLLNTNRTEILRELVRHCAKPQKIVGSKKQTWIFNYAGEEINYFPPTPGFKGIIYLKQRARPLEGWIRVTSRKETVKLPKKEGENL